MKRVVLLLALFLSLNATLSAQDFSRKPQPPGIIPPAKEPLKTAEELEYNVEWLGVAVGNITLQIKGIENVDGFECYHIVAHTQPNSFFGAFYDVEYTVHTYIDSRSFLTRLFEKTRRMGGKSIHEIIDFDRQRNKISYKSEGSAPKLLVSTQRPELDSVVRPTKDIASDTQDLFSSLYYLRGKDIKEDQDYALSIYYGDRNWDVTFHVDRPFLKEIRKLGSCQVFKVRLSSQLNNYILGYPDIAVYFTADARRVPIEFKIGTGIGSFRGIIKKLP